MWPGSREPFGLKQPRVNIAWVTFKLDLRKKKAYVRLTQDYDALDVANRIGII